MANLSFARLRDSNLSDADLTEAVLHKAYLEGSNLRGANLDRADLGEARLQGADLTGAKLSRVIMIGTYLQGANLTGCHVFGISAWGLKLSDDTKQKNLILTSEEELEISTDDIELAQFLYLMLHNEKVRSVIDTITSKVVLILGRFAPERKLILDALRDELRNRGYVPVVFDFDKPGNQTIGETVALLARMARFVIADLTDAKSVLQELRDIVPNNPSLAVQPLVLVAEDEPGMFDFFKKFPWVLKTYRYNDLPNLTSNLDYAVVRPVEAKVLELRGLANI